MIPKDHTTSYIVYLNKSTNGFKFCLSRPGHVPDFQLRGNQVKILSSRAAVSVQLHFISIVVRHEKGNAALLREPEYLLKATPGTTRNRKWGGGFFSMRSFSVDFRLL